MNSKFLSPSITGCLVVLFMQQSAQATTYIEYGWQCLRLRQYQNAEGYFRAEIAVNSKNPEAHLGLSEALYFEHRNTESFAELQKTQQLDPHGSFGSKASAALAKFHRVTPSSVKPQATSVSAVASNRNYASGVNGARNGASEQDWVGILSPAQQKLYRVKLTNGQIFQPLNSPHGTESVLRILKKMEEDRNFRIEEVKKRNPKWIAERMQRRDQEDPSSKEWREQQRFIDDNAKDLYADLLEIDADYVDKCISTNQQFENTWYIKVGSKLPHKTSTDNRGGVSGAKNQDALNVEQDKRLVELQAEGASKIHEIENKREIELKKLKDEKNQKLNANSTDEYRHQVQSVFDHEWDQCNKKYKDEILQVRETYQKLEVAVQDSSLSLKSQKKRSFDDDARLVPAGLSNTYARTYETYGDASGNPIPLIAVPNALPTHRAGSVKKPR